MPTSDIRTQVATAMKAVENKKAEDVSLLQLPSESSTFTDYFLICSGNNPRQVQAIADEVDERLSKDLGVEPNAREGYTTAEWILLDYVHFVVHIFNAQRRAYYDLERLWKSADRLTMDELLKGKKPAAAAKEAAPAVKKPARKTAKKAVGIRAAARQGARGTKAKGRKPTGKPAAKTSVKKAVKKAAKKAVKKTAKKATKKSRA
jgi:ribosome-associated protein